MLSRFCLAVGLLFFSIGETALALPITDSQTTIIALTGNPAPGGGSYRAMYIEPVMNNAGQVAFAAELQGISAGVPRGMFRWNGTHTTAIGGPGVNPALQFVGVPVINEAGEVAFYGSTPSLMNSIYRGAGGTPTVIASQGQTAPGGGEFAYLPVDPQLNDLGQVSMGMSFNATSGVLGGLYRGSGGALTEIARLQRPAPTGGNYVEFKHVFPINNLGQVAFAARTSIANSGAIFLGDGNTTIKIAQHGDVAPDGDGTFGNLGSRTPALNDLGNVAFFGRVEPYGGGMSYDGVYLNTGGTVTQLIRQGDTVPSGDATFYTHSYGPVINNKSQVAFVASLLKPSEPLDPFRAVLRVDEIETLEIMREGATAPGGNGQFLDFGNPEINELGHVALMVQLTNTAGGNSDDQALYFYSPGSNLKLVARKGQAILGSTIESLNFTGGLNHVETTGDEGMGMNDLGQVSYVFRLTDGRSGIAVWQIPEPSTAILLVLTCLSLIVRASR